MGGKNNIQNGKNERRGSIPVKSEKNITLSIEEKDGKLCTDAYLGSSHSPDAVKEKSNGLLNNLMMLHLSSYKGPFIKALSEEVINAVNKRDTAGLDSFPREFFSVF